MPPESIAGKFSRLDLNLTVDNKLVNVEVQLSSEDYYINRALFYWAKLYTSELKSGEEYDKLKQTIGINIIDFNLFEDNDFHHQFAVMEVNKKFLLSDKFCIHFYELNKVNDKLDINNLRQLWLQFMKAESEEALEMLEQTNIPIMQKAVQVIRNTNQDAQMRELAWLREKSLHDEATALKNAERKGIEKGIEKGIDEERQRTILKLKAMGMTDEEIERFYLN